MQCYGFDSVNWILRPWAFLYWALKKIPFTISIATFLCWAFYSKQALVPICSGWMELKKTDPCRSQFSCCPLKISEFVHHAYTFASVSEVCTWPTETKKSLDQQAGAKIGCWVTLRGCGTLTLYLTALPPTSFCIMPEESDNPGAAEVSLQWKALRGLPDGAAIGLWNKSWAL